MSSLANSVPLNQRAVRVVRRLIDSADLLRVRPLEIGGATIVDCGVESAGGLEAGRLLALATLADLATVSLQPNHHLPGTGLAVHVASDQPLWCCLAAQYAGWPLQQDNYFAMASGPMRLLRGREELLGLFTGYSRESLAVGVLEAAKFPTEEVVAAVAQECHVDPRALRLLVAPTRSIAGTLQIVARSVETALHKLHEVADDVGFDLHSVVSASGSAPLPPPSADDMTAIGRTNDAILYGARVTLWVDADDGKLAELAPRLPSSASRDHGKPFREIFERVNGDFYAIDPLLFSPAAVSLISIRSGSTFSAGGIDRDLLRVSFGVSGEESHCES